MQSVGALTGAGAARGRVLGSRRRRGASEAAIDEARTRLAHATATRSLHSLLIQPPLLHLYHYTRTPRTSSSATTLLNIHHL